MKQQAQARNETQNSDSSSDDESDVALTDAQDQKAINNQRSSFRFIFHCSIINTHNFI
jgi:hypothetical protein